MPKATYSQDINFTSDKLPDWAGISEIRYSLTSMPYPFTGGVHAKIFGYHRSLSKRFPFAIYRGEYCPRPCRVGLPPPTFVDQAHSWR